MKFRYYITDTFDGIVTGSNDETKVTELADCEEFFVIDTETGEMLESGGGRMAVEETK